VTLINVEWKEREGGQLMNGIREWALGRERQIWSEGGRERGMMQEGR